MVYLNDILITVSTVEAHLKALEEVLSRLQRVDLRVKQKKCVFISLVPSPSPYAVHVYVR